jgi:hypothetical protein
MASSSIHVRDDSDFKSEVREDGVPKENWSQYEVQSYNWNNKTT